eukprot:363701-Pyramimonas_sp.AAC.1
MQGALRRERRRCPCMMNRSTLPTGGRPTLFAIALGLCTFDNFLRRRKVRVWGDSVGAETVTSRGSPWDYCCLVNCLWLKAAQQQIALRVDRAPSKFNIADLPSREEYDLLALLGSVR